MKAAHVVAFMAAVSSLAVLIVLGITGAAALLTGGCP